jgi:predicted HAD superfamily Cof-like phosphohydrolase
MDTSDRTKDGESKLEAAIEWLGRRWLLHTNNAPRKGKYNQWGRDDSPVPMRGVVPDMNTLEAIAEWFRRAVPEPTKTNISVQVGCHFEEVAEFAAAAGVNRWVVERLDDIAGELKYEKPEIRVDPVPALDALCDQIVTAIGVAHMCGWDILGALAEVNRSNWSKFVESSPVFDATGKIGKGPDYTPPDLTRFVEENK